MDELGTPQRLDTNNLEVPDQIYFAHIEAEESEKKDGALVHGVRSLAYTAIQDPINGVAEIASKVTGKDLLPDVQLIDHPDSAEFASRKWHAGQIGSAVAIGLTFAIFHKGVGKIAGNKSCAKTVEKFRAFAGKRADTLSVAASGALYEGLFRPVGSEEGSFIGNRVQHALEGGVTFGAMAATGKLIKGGIAARAGTESRLAKVAASDVVAYSTAGLPVGAGRAQITSLLDGDGFASAKETAQSAYGFFVVGGTLGGVKTVGRQLKVAESTAKAPKHKSLNVLIIEDQPGFRKPIEKGLVEDGIDHVTSIAGVDRVAPGHIYGIKPGANASPLADTYNGNPSRIVDLRPETFDVALVDGNFLGRVKSGELVIPELKKSVPVVVAISGGGTGNPVLLKAGADFGVPKELLRPLIKEGKLDLEDLRNHPDHIPDTENLLPGEVEALRQRYKNGEDFGSLDMS